MANDELDWQTYFAILDDQNVAVPGGGGAGQVIQTRYTLEAAPTSTPFRPPHHHTSLPTLPAHASAQDGTQAGPSFSSAALHAPDPNRPPPISDQEFFSQLTRSLTSNPFPPPSSYPSPNQSQPPIAGPSSLSIPPPRSALLPTEAAREPAARAQTGGGSGRQTSHPHPCAHPHPPSWSDPTINLAEPSVPNTPLQGMTPAPETADTEEKRSRNTLASAKFRAKRKQHVGEVQRQITDLEGTHGELTREVGELRRENGFLRAMVQMKYGLDVDKSLGSRQ